MDTTTAICAGFGLAACAIAIAGQLGLSHRSRTRSTTETIRNPWSTPKPSPDAARQRPTRSRPSGSVPDVRRPTSGGPQLAALEAQLRTAILSAGARDRLVQDALKTVNGDRDAAIRKVLNDLADENKRWS